MITREQAVQAAAHILAAEAIAQAEGIIPQASADLVRDLEAVSVELEKFDGAGVNVPDEELHGLILTHLDMAVAIVKDGAAL